MKKFLISLAILILILALVLPLALKVFFPEEKLRAMALPRAEAALQRSVDLEKISLGLDLQGLRLKMRGLSLGPDSLGTGLTNLELPSLDARLAWGPLLRKELAIRSLHLEGAVIDLLPAPAAAGNPNDDGAAAPEGSAGLALAVAAPDVRLNDTRVRLQLPESDVPLTLGFPEMRFASLLDPEGGLDLSGHIELDEITGGLPAGMEQGGRLKLDFVFAAPPSAFEGAIDPAALNLEATLSAEDLELNQSGPQEMSLKVPSAEANLNAEGGRFALVLSPLELLSSSLPGPLELEQCRLSGDAGVGDLVLEALELRRGESRLSAEGRVRGLPLAPAMELDLHSTLLDLADFLLPVPEAKRSEEGSSEAAPPVPLLPPLPEGVIDFVVEQLRHPRAELNDLKGRVLVGAQGLSLEDLNGAIYGGRLQGRLDLRPDETDPTLMGVSGDFQISDSQAPALLAAFTPIDRGLEGVMGSQLGLTFGLRPGEPPHDLNLDADLDLREGALQGLPHLKALARAAGLPGKDRYAIGRVRQKVTVEDDRVNMRDLRLPFEDGWVELGGSAGLLGDLDFDGRWEPGPETLARLGKGELLNWLADAEGKVILDFHVGGTAREPSVTLDTSSLQRRLVQEAEERLREDGEELLQQGLDALRKRLK